MTAPLEGQTRHEAWIQAARHQFEQVPDPSSGSETTLALSPDSPRAGSAEASSFQLPGYHLVREAHRGGQGVVYEAIQHSTRRRVAIKVMREGPFAGPSDRARFDREVQVLAQLSHANIVAIHDSGSAAGHDYFVMDFVDGAPLDRHVQNTDKSKSPALSSSKGRKVEIENLLRLFVKVCDAVNAAHLRGVIHRDLKPSNILVDALGAPRVLDFGLAKFADGTSDDSGPTMTVTGQFVGSLPWCSPEQAGGDAIDMRTDVYSLGVVLFQCLTGHFPYPVAGHLADVLSHVRTSEPIRPRTLQAHINDEVETIVLKCLSKDRERRYQTAGELARDIGHYLAGEPIEAKRDSAFYVLSKHLQRHKAAVAVAAGFGVLLTLASVALSILYQRAETQAIVAGQQRQSAERVAEFMSQTLEGAGPAVAKGRDATMLREMMDAAAKRIKAGELQTAPEAELRLRLTIGDTYRQLAAYDAAGEIMGPAVELARAIHGEEHSEVAESLNAAASLQKDRGQAADALPDYEAALKMYQRLSEADHPDVAGSLSSLASCLESLGRAAEALPKYEAALEMYQRLFAGDHTDVARGLNNVAYCLHSLGRRAEALPRFESALEMKQRLFAGDHPEVAGGLNNLASCLDSLGRSADALPKYEAALQMSQRLFAGDHPEVATCLNNVALCLYSLGRRAEALSKFEAALEVLQRLFPDGHPRVATCLSNVAGCLQSLGRPWEALPKYEAALDMQRRLFPGDHPGVAGGLNNVAAGLASVGRAAEALPMYEAALEMRQRLFVGDHPGVAGSLNNVAACLQSLERSAAALPLYEAALEMRQRLFAGDHPDVVQGLNNVGACLQSLDRATEGLPMFERALEMQQRLSAGDHPGVAIGLNNLAYCLHVLGRPAEALPKYEAALAIRKQVGPPDHMDRRISEVGLGAVLVDLNQLDEAEPLLLESYAAMAGRPDAPTKHRQRAVQALVKLYQSRHAAEPDRGYDVKAEEWRAKLEPHPDG